MSCYNIPNPCAQKWESLTPDGNDRFCSACNKKVIDLTALSQEEIDAAWHGSSSSLCGKISGKQLRDMYVGHKLRQSWWSSACSFCFALLLAFGTSLFSVKDASARSRLVGMSSQMRSIMCDSLKSESFITGTVKDKESKEMLPPLQS